MKKWLKRIAIAGFILAVVATGLGYVFRDDLHRYLKRYMRSQMNRSIASYGSNLPPIDEIRLLRLANKPAQPDLGTFKIPFHEGPDLRIVADKTLAGTAAQSLANQWRQLRLHNDYMAGCYDPHHVLQFRSGGKVICEAVMCFACGNTTLPAFPIRTLVSFENADGGSPSYRQFKQSVEAEIGAHVETK